MCMLTSNRAVPTCCKIIVIRGDPTEDFDIKISSTIMSNINHLYGLQGTISG